MQLNHSMKMTGSCCIPVAAYVVEIQKHKLAAISGIALVLIHLFGAFVSLSPYDPNFHNVKLVYALTADSVHDEKAILVGVPLYKHKQQIHPITLRRTYTEIEPKYTQLAVCQGHSYKMWAFGKATIFWNRRR